MKTILGPAPCQGCGIQVVYSRGLRGEPHWRSLRGTLHFCADSYRTKTGRCGIRFGRYGERCARRPAHGYEHRTRYALDNAKVATELRRQRRDRASL